MRVSLHHEPASGYFFSQENQVSYSLISDPWAKHYFVLSWLWNYVLRLNLADEILYLKVSALTHSNELLAKVLYVAFVLAHANKGDFSQSLKSGEEKTQIAVIKALPVQTLAKELNLATN